MPSFSPHQDAALNAVANWLKDKPGSNGTPQVFRLFGYAGTGKTTLARHLAEHADGEVKFAAFTGKAASVMRGKGCKGASTIHSLIYRARESGEEIPSFDLWDDAPASKAELIIIDECSMVDAEPVSYTHLATAVATYSASSQARSARRSPASFDARPALPAPAPRYTVRPRA